MADAEADDEVGEGLASVAEGADLSGLGEGRPWWTPGVAAADASGAANDQGQGSAEPEPVSVPWE